MALTDQEAHQMIADGLVPAWRSGFADGLKTAIDAVIGSLNELEEYPQQLEAFARGVVDGLQKAVEQIAEEGPLGPEGEA